MGLIDELEGYHANRTTNYMFCTTSETEFSLNIFYCILKGVGQQVLSI